MVDLEIKKISNLNTRIIIVQLLDYTRINFSLVDSRHSIVAHSPNAAKLPLFKSISMAHRLTL